MNRRVVSREDIIAAERSLYRVRHDIMSKRDTLSRQDQLGGDSLATSGRPSMIRSTSGWLDIFGSGGSSSSTEGNAIRRELQGLEMMEGQVKRSLEAMKLRRVSERNDEWTSYLSRLTSCLTHRYRNVSDSRRLSEERFTTSLGSSLRFIVSHGF